MVSRRKLLGGILGIVSAFSAGRMVERAGAICEPLIVPVPVQPKTAKPLMDNLLQAYNGACRGTSHYPRLITVSPEHLKGLVREMAPQERFVARDEERPIDPVYMFKGAWLKANPNLRGLDIAFGWTGEA